MSHTTQGGAHSPSQHPTADVGAIRDYWDVHTLGFQYQTDPDIEVGSREFFDNVRPWMTPFKFPWIMTRIKREAPALAGKRLLEIGCGLGFVSLEFLKRGVHVTATDLTPNAVKLAKIHLALEGVTPDDVRIENALDLHIQDESFDAVWSNGVIHATGDPPKAIREIRRVLKPGGRAIISHFYRRPSWMYSISRLGRENVEFTDQDPPVNEFMREREILALFKGFRIEETAREHYRALPIVRRGVKAFLYTHGFRPVYNLLPLPLARRLAYKFSVTATKV